MEGELHSLKERAATGLWKVKWRVPCTEIQHFCPSVPNLRHASVSTGGDQMLKLRIWRSDPGEGLGLDVQKQSEEVRL